jgi:membrane-associated phospholipid phosphatase
MTASGRPAKAAPRFGVRAALGFTAIFLAAVPFALLTALVKTAFSPLEHLDRDVAEDLHEFVMAHPIFTAAMRVVTDSGAALVWWLVLTPVFLWLVSRRLNRLATFVAVTAIGSSLLNLAIKTAINRTRPQLPDALVVEPGKSFPSGHTQAAIVGYGVLLLVLLPLIKPRHRPWAIAAAVTMVVLIGFSRIALGAHYLSDVIGAALIGSAWLTAMTAAFSAWRRDRGLPPVTPEKGLEPEAADRLKPGA